MGTLVPETASTLGNLREHQQSRDVACYVSTDVRKTNLTSSPPYKDGDSSPRPRGLATKRLESLIGVDSSTHTASKRSYTRSLSVLSLGMPSRDYMYRLDQKTQIMLFVCLQVGSSVALQSFPIAGSVPVSTHNECISLQANAGF